MICESIWTKTIFLFYFILFALLQLYNTYKHPARKQNEIRKKRNIHKKERNSTNEEKHQEKRNKNLKVETHDYKMCRCCRYIIYDYFLLFFLFFVCLLLTHQKHHMKQEFIFLILDTEHTQNEKSKYIHNNSNNNNNKIHKKIEYVRIVFEEEQQQQKYQLKMTFFFLCCRLFQLWIVCVILFVVFCISVYLILSCFPFYFTFYISFICCLELDICVWSRFKNVIIFRCFFYLLLFLSHWRYI